MKKNSLFIISIFLVSFALINSCRPRSKSRISGAGGSDCVSSNTKTKPQVNQGEIPLQLFNQGEVSHKQPLLVYYAVDTKEPFFQATINYELKQLKEACSISSGTKKVNWVALVNSHFVKSNQFLYCRGGVLKTETYANYPQLNNQLKKIQDLILSEDEEKYQNNLTFHVSFSKEHKKDFAEHLFSHPETLRYLLEFAQTQLFKEEEITPFLHMKSHGSSRLFLTGLSESDLTKKIDCQKISILGTNSEPKPSQPLSTKINTWETYIDDIYGKVGITGANFSELDELMDVSKLRINNTLGTESDPEGLGTNDGAEGLGSENGDSGLGEFGTTNLGADNSFGLDQPAFLSVLVYLSERKIINQPMGFVFAESCESTVSKKSLVKKFFDTQPEIKGYFSADGSLRYHNINWNIIYKNWLKINGGVIEFQKAIAEASKNVYSTTISEK